MSTGVQGDFAFAAPHDVYISGYPYPPSIIVENRGGEGGLEARVALLESLLLPKGSQTEVVDTTPQVPAPAQTWDDDEYYDDQDWNGYSGDAQDPENFFVEEAGVKLCDKIKLVEQSAKAIETMNDVMLQKSWCACSNNTYGFLVRNLLLMGSIYKNQLVEDTSQLFTLSLVGVFFSVGMQFVLAYYLFVSMPPYYNDDGSPGKRTVANAGTAPLPAYLYPSLLYQNANDVCRTVQIVQLCCIGLFLFFIINNVPGIVKHILIIVRSERFISKDEEDVSKIHYWRESDFSRDKCNSQVRRDYLESLMRGGDCKVFCPKGCLLVSCDTSIPEAYHCDKCKKTLAESGSIEGFRTCVEHDFDLCCGCYAASGRIEMQKTFRLEVAPDPQSLSVLKSKNTLGGDEMPRSFFEITDSRNFLGEVLRDLDDGKDEDKDELLGSSSNHPGLTFADTAKINLVRADYLCPNFNCIPPWSIFVPFFHTIDAYLDCSALLSNSKQLGNAVRRAAGKQAVKDQGGGSGSGSGNEGLDWPPELVALHKAVCRKQFKDLPYFVEMYPFKFRFIFFRVLALLLGVFPEIASLVMITITGIQYILWSGSKVGSDSSGIEEIILATVAITFIYDIDEAMYDNIFPDCYKEAHERDQFEIIGWSSRGSSNAMKLVSSLSFTWKVQYYRWRLFCHNVFKSGGLPKVDTTLSKKEVGIPPDSEAWDSKKGQKMLKPLQRKRRKQLSRNREWNMQDDTDTNGKTSSEWHPEFDVNVPLTVQTVCDLSVEPEYSDLYLNLQYPFLYAKKYNFFFASHFWLNILESYSTTGTHFLLLLTLSLAVVGTYRTSAQCNRFAPDGWNTNSPLSIWATQEWPQTCIMSAGAPVKTGSDFTKLYDDTSGFIMPVSCGATGYLPTQDKELQRLVDAGYAKDKVQIPSG